MRWAAGILLLTSGCSLILGSDDDDGPASADAAPAVDSSIIELDAFAGNVSDYTRPYDCDDETLALYHLDGLSGAEACLELELDLTSPKGTREVHAGFGDAATFIEAESRYKSIEGPHVLFENELTIEAWVKVGTQPATLGDELYIVTSNGEFDQNGMRRFTILLVGDVNGYVIRAEIDDALCGNAANIAEAGVILDTDWHHIAIGVLHEPVASSVSLDIFLDGVHLGRQLPNDAAGVCGDADAPAAHIMVGGLVRQNQQTPIPGDFDHSIDEVRISRTLRFNPSMP